MKLKMPFKFGRSFQIASQHGESTRRPSSTDSFTAEIARKNAIKKSNIKTIRNAMIDRNNKWKLDKNTILPLSVLTGKGSTLSHVSTEVRAGSTMTYRRGNVKAEDTYDPLVWLRCDNGVLLGSLPRRTPWILVYLDRSQRLRQVLLAESQVKVTLT